jgi:alpha-glucosidase (family GH31 glycosyl hydrolase)
VPFQFDSSRYTRFVSLTQRAANGPSIQFTTDQDWSALVEAHAPGVFRVRIDTTAEGATVSRAARPSSQRYELLARDEAIGEATVESVEGGFRLTQGEDVLELLVNPLRIVLSRKGAPVLSSIDDAEIAAFGVGGLVGDDTQDREWTVAFALQDGESVYGLGENVYDLDRRGEVLATDDPAARVLPLAWSTRGWGVYVNTAGATVHSIGVDAEAGYLAGWRDINLDVFLFLGDPSEILNQYSQLTGRAGQPPLWAMGAWVRQARGAAPELAVDLAAQLRERGIAFDAITLDAPGAWDVRSRLALEWDAKRFPDPRQLLGNFKRHDARVILPGFPGVLQSTPMFEELEDKGWLLTDETGGAHAFPGVAATGGEAFGLLDLTHKDVWTFWRDKLRQFQDDGVDAVACDAQIDMPEGVVARNGDTGSRLRTAYPLLVKRCLFEAASWNKTPAEGVVASHDLLPGAQRLPWQTATPVANTWDGLIESIRAALTVGSSGVPVHMHDVGNPELPTDGLTSELYLRWLGAAVFSGNLRLHASPGLLPWDFDDETQAHVRTWLQFRYRLIPYVLGVIEDSARTGLPVQRSMPLAFPDDPVAHGYGLQYLLGPALLIVPMVQPGTTVTVYLPKGDAWWDMNTGWRYEGGTTWTIEVGLDRLPVFGREGHMLCLGPAAQHTGEFNSARILDEVWLFGMPIHNPSVMRNKIRVMQMQGSSYVKGLEGLKILPSEGLEVKRRGAEVRISRAR